MPVVIKSWVNRNLAQIYKKAQLDIAAKAGDAVRDRAQKRAPIFSGKLRNSIQRGPVVQDATGTRVEVFVGSDAMPYGYFQEVGTKAHGPVRARMLAWRDLGKGSYGTFNALMVATGLLRRGRTKGYRPSSGGFIYAKWVRGVKPVRYMERAITDPGITQLLLALTKRMNVEVSTRFIVSGRG